MPNNQTQGLNCARLSFEKLSVSCCEKFASDTDRDGLISSVWRMPGTYLEKPWARVSLPVDARTAENTLLAFKRLLVDHVVAMRIHTHLHMHRQCIVVGNPANTNALILSKAAPNIPVRLPIMCMLTCPQEVFRNIPKMMRRCSRAALKPARGRYML